MTLCQVPFYDGHKDIVTVQAGQFFQRLVNNLKSRLLAERSNCSGERSEDLLHELKIAAHFKVA